LEMWYAIVRKPSGKKNPPSGKRRADDPPSPPSPADRAEILALARHSVFPRSSRPRLVEVSRKAAEHIEEHINEWKNATCRSDSCGGSRIGRAFSVDRPMAGGRLTFLPISAGGFLIRRWEVWGNGSKKRTIDVPFSHDFCRRWRGPGIGCVGRKGADRCCSYFIFRAAARNITRFGRTQKRKIRLALPPPRPEKSPTRAGMPRGASVRFKSSSS